MEVEEQVVRIDDFRSYFNIELRKIEDTLLRIGNLKGRKLMHKDVNGNIITSSDYFNLIIDEYKCWMSQVPQLQEVSDNAGINIPFKKGYYLYYLLNNKRIVYIGQTVNLCARIGTHISTGKVFNDVFFKEVKREDLLMLESCCIYDFKPDLNEDIDTELSMFEKIVWRVDF